MRQLTTRRSVDDIIAADEALREEIEPICRALGIGRDNFVFLSNGLVCLGAPLYMIIKPGHETSIVCDSYN
jgi:hypothetical protein